MSRCRWLERDEEGRPRCVHGWAHKSGPAWRCPLKSYLNAARYYRTEPGREHRRLQNANERAKSRKALYELTRVRVT